MPGGRGGKMKFWAHKNNIAKHLVRALGDGAGAVGHGTGLRSYFFEDNLPVGTGYYQNGIARDTMTIKIERYYPYFRRFNNRTIDQLIRKTYDTLIYKKNGCPIPF